MLILLDKDTIRSYIKNCYKKAGNFNTQALDELEMKKLRKRTESLVRVQPAYTTTSILSVRSKKSVKHVDELDDEDFPKQDEKVCPFEKCEINLESKNKLTDEEDDEDEEDTKEENEQYMDNNYWHSTGELVSDQEIKGLLS